MIIEENATRATKLVPLGQERTFLVENLDSVIGPVSYIESTIGIHRDGV